MPVKKASSSALERGASATPSPAPAAPPTRAAKPIRITLDLTPADYQALNRWVTAAAVQVDPEAIPYPRITQAQALRAMIRTADTDDMVSGAVIGMLRKDNGQ